MSEERKGLKITGTVERVGEIKQITDTFRKASFGVTIIDNPEYPQIVEFSLSGKSIENHYDKLIVGSEISVIFSLRGRKWTDKIINDLDAYAIFVENAADPPAPAKKEEEEDDLDFLTEEQKEEGESDDLPF